MPNRPSPENGWLSNVAKVFDSCFSGPKGPWVAKVQERLAIQLDDVARQFETLVSRFCIISLYEADELVTTNRAVCMYYPSTWNIFSPLTTQTLSKHCATLGVVHEEIIPIPDQSQLRYLQPTIFEHMSKSIVTCVLCTWPSDFANASLTLSSISPQARPAGFSSLTLLR